MNLSSDQNLKQFLKQYQIRPSKRLGQHFLIDKNVLQKIIKAADLSPQDVILEIGPAFGILTLELAKKTKKVIAIEKDPKMCQVLQSILERENIKNVEIINQDFLKYKLPDIIKYGIVANLPYYIASPVIRKLLEAENQPQKMILMVQKEVAQRICAKPRQERDSPKAAPQMSILAVSIQYYAEPKIITYVSKESFWPKPKVDSSIIQIIPLILRPSSTDAQLFFKIVRAGFASPRKQLAGNLTKNLKIERQKIEKIFLQCGLDPKQRAGTLSVDNWKKLSLLISKK